jgi:protein-disulfide isomerase
VSSNCPKCPAAKNIIEKLREKREDVNVQILDVIEEENYLTALMLQIASTPAFVIENTKIYAGEVPTLSELNAKIDEYKQKFC